MPFRRTAPSVARSAGFTTIELLVVVGISAAVMAIIVLGVRVGTNVFQLRRAASITLSEVRRAQALAMAEGVDYTVEFSTSTSGTAGGIRVWKTGVGTPVRTVLVPEWPQNIQMQDVPTTFPACTAPADTTRKCVVYKSLGYPLSGGKVRVATSDARMLDVVVEPATGRVSVQR